MTAYAFFRKHVGFSYDPKRETPTQGRRRCAQELAKAEAAASEQGISFVWEADVDGCIGCDCGSRDCGCSTGTPHEVLGCIAYALDGTQLGSLWGICEPSREYKRVIEAELALEAIRAS